MIIGVAKEVKDGETRAGLLPQDAQQLIADGHTVYVEAGTGVLSGHPDEEYEAVGCLILPDIADVYEKAEMVLFLSEESHSCRKADLTAETEEKAETLFSRQMKISEL